MPHHQHLSNRNPPLAGATAWRRISMTWDVATGRGCLPPHTIIAWTCSAYCKCAWCPQCTGHIIRDHTSWDTKSWVRRARPNVTVSKKAPVCWQLHTSCFRGHASSWCRGKGRVLNIVVSEGGTHTVTQVCNAPCAKFPTVAYSSSLSGATGPILTAEGSLGSVLCVK
jgi:hypothetical protein